MTSHSTLYEFPDGMSDGHVRDFKIIDEYQNDNYRLVSNTSCTLVGNEFVDHSD